MTGQVREFNGLTELVGPLQVSVLASGVALPTPAGISLPLASADALERYEGMRVQLRQTLTVNEVYNLGRYGEVLLSSGGRQMTPTNVVAPGEQAKAMQARNDLDRILLDDGRSGQNPDPIRYPAPELSAYNSLRVGDRTSAIDGVLDYSAGSYRIQPLQTPTFEAANPRPAQPAVEGACGWPASTCSTTSTAMARAAVSPSRGANTAEEFQRQKAKIVAAILASKADIVGLMEIENDGYGEFSAIADLVNGLNASLPQGQRYAFVNPNRAKLGSDEIAVGLIYRGDKVRTYRSAAVLDSSVNPEFDDTRNRPTLAQTFQEINGGERLTIAVNHLKSKGSACDGDPDTGDGQGNCNLTRARAAQALVDWLAGDPTGAKEPDRLIIGDLNSYAKEDPVNVIRGAGYTDLVARQAGAGKGYSYVFSGQSGYLDHALANASLARQVRGAVEWHINADEPRVLDYNVEFKTPRQQDSLYNAEPYRASDHDPVVIGIDLRRVAMKKHRRQRIAPVEGHPRVAFLHGTWPGRANNRLRLSAVVVGSRRITPVALFAPRNGAPSGWPSSVARGPGRANNRLRLSAVAAGYRRITPVAYSPHGTEAPPGSYVVNAQRRQVAQFHQLDVRFADALEMFATGFVHRFAAVQQQGATAGNVDQLRSRREVRGP